MKQWAQVGSLASFLIKLCTQNNMHHCFARRGISIHGNSFVSFLHCSLYTVMGTV